MSKEKKPMMPMTGVKYIDESLLKDNVGRVKDQIGGLRKKLRKGFTIKITVKKLKEPKGIDDYEIDFHGAPCGIMPETTWCKSEVVGIITTRIAKLLEYMEEDEH